KLLLEALVRRLSERRLGPALDVSDDPVGQPDQLGSALGGDDELRPPVARLGAALDVSELLELVDGAADHLLGAPRAARELGGARPVEVEVTQDRAVRTGHLAVAGLLETGVELVLEGEEEPGCEDAEAWVAR